MPSLLMLVRHAEPSNRELRSQVWREVGRDHARFEEEYARRRVHNPGLSERGRVQAKELAARLISDIHLFEEDALIVTSPMLRALETALPLIRRAQLPEERVVCHPELFELRSSFPYRERRPSELAAELEAEFGLRCCELPDDEAYPAREDPELEDEAKARAERTWTWLSELLDTERCALVIVIAHGGLISRWLQLLFGAPQGRSVSFAHNHAGLTTLLWDDDEVVIQGLNDSDHVIKGFRVDHESMYKMMLSMLDEYEERGDEGAER